MLGWKKIAMVLGLSATAGLLGAACSLEEVDTEDGTDAVDAVTTVDTPDDGAGDAVDETLNSRGPSWGGGFGRPRCSNRCRDDYASCGRDRRFSSNPVERERRCRRRLNDCLLDCRRF